MHTRFEAERRRSRWEQNAEGSPYGSHSRRAGVGADRQPPASRGVQQSQPARSRGGVGASGSAGMISQYQRDPIEPSALTGNKYKDREMRLHQSIIYNRARLKVEQQQKQRAARAEFEEEEEHSAYTEPKFRTQSQYRYSPPPGSSMASLQQRTAAWPRPNSTNFMAEDNRATTKNLMRYSQPPPSPKESPPQQQSFQQNQHHPQYQNQQKQPSPTPHHQQPMPLEAMASPMSDVGGSMLSGLSKPFDERAAVRQQNQDAALATTVRGQSPSESVPSSHSSGERKQAPANTRAAPQDLLMPEMRATPVATPTPDRSSTSQSSTSPALNSNGDSTHSSFWKQAAPPPDNNNAVTTEPNRFKLPPARISDPCTTYAEYQEQSYHDQEGEQHYHDHEGQSVQAMGQEHFGQDLQRNGGIPADDEYHHQQNEHPVNHKYRQSPLPAHEMMGIPPPLPNYHADDHDAGGYPAESNPVAATVQDPDQAPLLAATKHSDLDRLPTTPLNDSSVAVFEEEKKEDSRPPTYQLENAHIQESKRGKDIILNHRDFSRDEEDDSLFGYLTEQSKQTETTLEDEESPGAHGKKKKTRNRTRRYADTTTDEDCDNSSADTASEGPRAQRKMFVSGSPRSLAKRSQQAWSKRQADLKQQDKNQRSPSRGKKGGQESSPSRTKKGHKSSPSRGKVSFGAVDTVHHYRAETPDRENVHDGDAGYTRSLESEVEDVFKDIFLIGKSQGPGRRGRDVPPPPPSPADESGYDDSTLDDTFDDTFASTEDGSTPDISPNHRSRNMESDEDRKKKGGLDPPDGEDPLLSGVWNMVESGVGAIGGALGFINPEDDESTILSDDTHSTRHDGKRSREPSTSPPRDPSASSALPPPGLSPKRNRSLLALVSDNLLSSEQPGPLPVAEKQAKTSKQPQQKEESRSLSSELSKEKQNGALEQERNPGPRNPSFLHPSPPSIEQDLRLIQLATESARVYHRMHGHEFDESQEVDIMTEIKFIVADMRLPMGAVFQENATGCWITKIMPGGYASKTSMAVGDQLAAIDGLSAIHMKVDQIADSVKGKTGEFELTLLRYVGKLRAAPVSEAGFEIKPKTVRPSKKNTSHAEAAPSADGGSSNGDVIDRAPSVDRSLQRTASTTPTPSLQSAKRATNPALSAQEILQQSKTENTLSRGRDPEQRGQAEPRTRYPSQTRQTASAHGVKGQDPPSNRQATALSKRQDPQQGKKIGKAAKPTSKAPGKENEKKKPVGKENPKKGGDGPKDKKLFGLFGRRKKATS